jgi:hypothetical protein
MRTSIRGKVNPATSAAAVYNAGTPQALKWCVRNAFLHFVLWVPRPTFTVSMKDSIIGNCRLRSQRSSPGTRPGSPA